MSPQLPEFKGHQYFIYDDPAAFGLYVNMCRKARKLTQSQLAQSVGCARETICSIEHGRHNISLALFVSIENFFADNPL